MKSALRTIFAFVLLSSCLMISAYAQQIEIDTGDTGNITIFPPSTADVRVTFTKDLDQTPARLAESLNTDNITLTVGGDNGRSLKPISVAKEPGSLQQVLIKFDYTKLSPEDTTFRICFKKLHYMDAPGAATTTTPVCASIDLLTPQNVKLKKALILEDLKKTSKTSEEKNIFASAFVSAGEGEKAEGGADISLNGDFGIPGLSAVMHLKKATALNADPKQFDVGLTYRSTYLFGRKRRDEIRSLLASNPMITDSSTAGARINELIAKEQRRIFAGILFDFSGKLEGEALKFNVTNAIFEGMLQVVSPTKRVGSNRASLKFRIIAVGVEAGKNLNKPDPTQQLTPEQAQQLNDVNWIARLKFGGIFSFYYRNRESVFPIKTVQLDLQAVNRYLFNREAIFDPASNKIIMTGRGNRHWFQADLKFYFTDPPEGTGGYRTGFKISFNRGSLPPVFADTNSFQFGLVFETVDINKAKK